MKQTRMCYLDLILRRGLEADLMALCKATLKRHKCRAPEIGTQPVMFAIIALADII
jgi:hypothetical protein